MNKDKLLTVAGVLFAAAGMVIIHTMDFNDSVMQHEYHCAGVELWLDDAKYGVQKEQRRGWPDYNNTCEVSK